MNDVTKDMGLLSLKCFVNTCRYILTKRPDENTDKPEEFRVNISRIEEIIKFYISTNREYKKL